MCNLIAPHHPHQRAGLSHPRQSHDQRNLSLRRHPEVLIPR